MALSMYTVSVSSSIVLIAVYNLVFQKHFDNTCLQHCTASKFVWN